MRGLGECNQTGVQQLAILKYDGGPNWPTRPSPTYNDTTDGVVGIKTFFIHPIHSLFSFIHPK